MAFKTMILVVLMAGLFVTCLADDKSVKTSDKNAETKKPIELSKLGQDAKKETNVDEPLNSDESEDDVLVRNPDWTDGVDEDVDFIDVDVSEFAASDEKVDYGNEDELFVY